MSLLVGSEHQISSWVVSLTVILFPTAVLLMPSGDSYAFMILAVSAGVLYFRGRKFLGFREHEKLYFYVVLAFLLVAFVNYVVTGVNNTGLKKLTRYAYLLFMFPFVGLFLRTRLKPVLIWGGLILGAISAGMFGIFEWFFLDHGGHLPRVGGALNPIRFGGISLFLSIASVVAFLYLKRIEQTNWAWLALFGACLGLFAAIASGTRGALLVAPVYVFILVSIYWKYLSVYAKTAVVSVCILVPIVVYALPESKVAARFEYAKADISAYLDNRDDVNAGNVRLEMWRNAYRQFTGSPIFGIGIGQYQIESKVAAAQGLVHPMVAEFKNAHSMYMSTLATQGIIGLILSLAVIALPALYFWGRIKLGGEVGFYSLILVLLPAGFLVLMLTNDLMDVKAPMMFFSVVMAQFLYLFRQALEEPTEPTS